MLPPEQMAIINAHATSMGGVASQLPGSLPSPDAMLSLGQPVLQPLTPQSRIAQGTASYPGAMLASYDPSKKKLTRIPVAQPTLTSNASNNKKPANPYAGQVSAGNGRAPAAAPSVVPTPIIKASITAPRQPKSLVHKASDWVSNEVRPVTQSVGEVYDLLTHPHLGPMIKGGGALGNIVHSSFGQIFGPASKATVPNPADVKALNTPIGRNTVNDIYNSYVGTGQLGSSIVKGNIFPSKRNGKGGGNGQSFVEQASGLVPGTLQDMGNNFLYYNSTAPNHGGRKLINVPRGWGNEYDHHPVQFGVNIGSTAAALAGGFEGIADNVHATNLTEAADAATREAHGVAMDDELKARNKAPVPVAKTPIPKYNGAGFIRTSGGVVKPTAAKLPDVSVRFRTKAGEPAPKPDGPSSYTASPVPKAKPIGAPTVTPLHRVRIVDQGNANTVELLGEGPKGNITIVAEHNIQDGILYLTKAHIDGPGAGSMGWSELNEFAQSYGKELGVKKVIVQGLARSTGAKKGHIPRPFGFEVK